MRRPQGPPTKRPRRVGPLNTPSHLTATRRDVDRRLWATARLATNQNLPGYGVQAFLSGRPPFPDGRTRACSCPGWRWTAHWAGQPRRADLDPTEPGIAAKN